jgi:hypothetical protein
VDEDEDRLIVFEITWEFDDETYLQIRSAVLEWYNEPASSVLYKLPPPTDEADNCATAFRRVGIPCLEQLHRGQLARFIDLLKSNAEIGANRWNPEGQEHDD